MAVEVVGILFHRDEDIVRASVKTEGVHLHQYDVASRYRTKVCGINTRRLQIQKGGEIECIDFIRSDYTQIKIKKKQYGITYMPVGLFGIICLNFRMIDLKKVKSIYRTME